MAGELHYSSVDRDADILEAPKRTLPPLVKSKRLQFGTIGYGLDLARLPWTAETHKFSCQDNQLSQVLPNRPPACLEGEAFQRVGPSFMKKHTTDALLVDEGDGSLRPDVTRHILALKSKDRPKALAFSGPVNWITSPDRINARRRRRKQLESVGYTQQEWYLEGHHQGGALEQERLVEVYLILRPKDLAPSRPRAQGLPPRPMQNLLLPNALVPIREWAPRHLAMIPCSSPSERAIKSQYTLKDRPVYLPEGCMPDRLGCWVDTERGPRRIQPSELAKAKGLPSEWRNKKMDLNGQHFKTDTCIHIWTVVCDALGPWLKGEREEKEAPRPAANKPCSKQDPGTRGRTTSRKKRDSKNRTPSPTSIMEAEDKKIWNYELPDLAEGGSWHQKRVANLKAVILGRPDEAELYLEGLEALAIHRQNYTEEGPKYLQVLWWEFPEAHREAVRVGSSLRFLVDPGEELIPNPPLTPEQLETVVKFVDELIALGVVRKATRKLRRVCPIFVVPKAGQPGQWRCIADMRRGGQNECCGLDPIYLPTSRDILPQLYSGGYSGVADASKYFHNYPTLDNERDLMGIIHPTTGEHLWYVGLPMGSVNSPSISCRIGEGILELLRAESPLFKATSRKENTWRSALNTGEYDQDLSHGYVSYQDNGNPVAQVYAFVDDFLIHAASWEECAAAMTVFMDLMVRLGMICQKVKTSPPSQIQKYCGFIYDCTGAPSLQIPPNKVSRCLASVDYLLSRPRDHILSRLSLAVIAGVLQSVVDATPQRLGQGHLRPLHDDLHRLDEEMDIPTTGAAKYYTSVELSRASIRALEWWRDFLEINPGAATCRSTSANGLVMKWGDGSGTGTGGTTELYPLTAAQERCPNIELWMGVWKVQAQVQTSNWKEARTILEALRQEKDGRRLKGATVFYMTDNLVSYYVINNGSSREFKLHGLVMEIKALELELGFHLEVVHVPGTLMIDQGTDGLSRGLWLAPERRPADVNQRLFDAVPLSPALTSWAMAMVGHAYQPCTSRDYLTTLSMREVAHQFSVWAPLPEGARQVIVSFLQMWVQSPGDTAGLFLVPRILQRKWGRICRYVEEIGVFHSAQLPDDCCFEGTLPFVLLFIGPHSHSLRLYPRLEPFAIPPGQRWHKEQADEVRGLL